MSDLYSLPERDESDAKAWFYLDHRAETLELSCFIAETQTHRIRGCNICSYSWSDNSTSFDIFIAVLQIGRSLAAGQCVGQRVRCQSALCEQKGRQGGDARYRVFLE